MATTVDIGGNSYQGARARQEDCFMAYRLTETKPKASARYTTSNERQVNLGILCDGMGGEGNGSICSRQAVQAFAEAFAETGSFDTAWYQRLRMALYAANAAILEYKINTNTENTNSGTTLIGAVISEEKLHYVSVGDSPMYLFRKQRNTGEYTASRINASHSHWFHYFTENGAKYKKEVSKDEADTINQHPSADSYCKPVGLYSAVCGSAIGYMDASGESGIDLLDGDIIMLCSDGVSGTLDESDMTNIIRNYSAPHHPAKEAAYQMIQAVKANAQARQDNASCIILKVHID